MKEGEKERGKKNFEDNVYTTERTIRVSTNSKEGEKKEEKF